MVARSCLVVALLALGCGGADGAPAFDTGPEAGNAGAPAQAGATAAGGGGQSSAGAQAGTGGMVAGTGQGGAAAGGGGQPEPQGGMPSAGSSSGGEPAGGKPGDGGGGSGGRAAGGTGGQASDPLEPKPLAGCPGYVKVFVPHGTCVWFHGTFTHQTETCNLVNPVQGTCGTASAVSKDIETIVSESAEITRFDFDATGCPKKCN